MVPHRFTVGIFVCAYPSEMEMGGPHTDYQLKLPLGRTRVVTIQLVVKETLQIHIMAILSTGNC